MLHPVRVSMSPTGKHMFEAEFGVKGIALQLEQLIFGVQFLHHMYYVFNVKSTNEACGGCGGGDHITIQPSSPSSIPTTVPSSKLSQLPILRPICNSYSSPSRTPSILPIMVPTEG